MKILILSIHKTLYDIRIAIQESYAFDLVKIISDLIHQYGVLFT